VNLGKVFTAENAAASMSVTRTPGTVVHTNLFGGRPKLEEWLEEGSLFHAAHAGASALLRPDRDFFHVYLAFSDPSGAIELLHGLSSDEILVTDVVGDGVRDRPLAEVFEEAGFAQHRLLRRMRRRPLAIDEQRADDLRAAEPADSPWMLDMLEMWFDRFSEQLPSARQLRRAIDDGNIRVATAEGDRAGFLYSEVVGIRSTLRYWFVSPERRDARVGGRLLRDYLGGRCADRTSELWVVDDNQNAIKRYVHYGYTSDALITRVMMRGPDHHGS
jgi:hypothetical protein